MGGLSPVAEPVAPGAGEVAASPSARPVVVRPHLEVGPASGHCPCSCISTNKGEGLETKPREWMLPLVPSEKEGKGLP